MCARCKCAPCCHAKPLMQCAFRAPYYYVRAMQPESPGAVVCASPVYPPNPVARASSGPPIVPATGVGRGRVRRVCGGIGRICAMLQGGRDHAMGAPPLRLDSLGWSCPAGLHEAGRRRCWCGRGSQAARHAPGMPRSRTGTGCISAISRPSFVHPIVSTRHFCPPHGRKIALRCGATDKKRRPQPGWYPPPSAGAASVLRARRAPVVGRASWSRPSIRSDGLVSGRGRAVEGGHLSRPAGPASSAKAARRVRRGRASRRRATWCSAGGGARRASQAGRGLRARRAGRGARDGRGVVPMHREG